MIVTFWSFKSNRGERHSLNHHRKKFHMMNGTRCGQGEGVVYTKHKQRIIDLLRNMSPECIEKVVFDLRFER